MAIQNIDPFEGFTSGLQLGLNTLKGFRDEARAEDDRLFNKRMAIEANDRANSAANLAIKADNREQGKYDEWVKEAPLRKKTGEEQLKGLQLGNINQEIQNKYLPLEKEESLKTSRHNRYINDQQVSQGWARINLERRQQARLEREAEDTAAIRAFTQYVEKPNPALLQNNPRVASSILKITGAAVGAPKLLEAVQNPFGAWRNNADDRRTVLSYANINRSKAAANLGLDAGTTAAVDLRPSKDEKGIALVTFVGYDPKLKRVVKREGRYVAEKLFDRAIVTGNTFNRIRNDPKARSAAVSGLAYADPKGFDSMLAQEVAKRKSLLKQVEANPAILQGSGNRIPDAATLQREIALLESGNQRMVERAVFDRMGGVGQMANLNQMYLALDRVMDKNPNLNEDQAMQVINMALNKGLSDNRFFTKMMSDAKIRLQGKGAAGKDPNARAAQILQAISRS